MQAAERLQPFLSTLEHLAGRWGSAGPLLPGFPLLAQGRPVSVAEIAKAADTGTREVEGAVDVARCERDARGRLIDLYGMTIDGKILFSCCALWAHVIPKLVDTTVQVDSVDPLQHESVHLSVSPSGVELANPRGAAATLAVANRQAIDTNVGKAFCHQVRHFVSRESSEAFAAERPSCHAIDVSELQLAAEKLYQFIWGAVDG